MADQQGPVFHGEKGAGADINLDVPLPGAHSGRRLLKIEDIADEYWSDEARGLGTDPGVAWGLSKDTVTDAWYVSDANRYVDKWTVQKSVVDPELAVETIEDARVAFIADAAEVMEARGSLRDWLREGKIFAAEHRGLDIEASSGKD